MIEISKSEKTRIRTLSLNVVRSIAKQHGGVIRKNQVSGAIVVSVPEAQKALCAQAIVDQLGGMWKYFLTMLLALLCGKVLVRINKN